MVMMNRHKKGKREREIEWVVATLSLALRCLRRLAVRVGNRLCVCACVRFGCGMGCSRVCVVFCVVFSVVFRVVLVWC